MSYLFFLLVSIYLPSQEAESLRSDEEVRLKAIQEWLALKRDEPLYHSAGNLSLSGDLRLKYNNFQIFDYDSSTNSFSVDFHLLLDYVNKNFWGSTKLSFENDMGIFTGTVNQLALERCYVGTQQMGITFECGRKILGNNFDSRIEFQSYLDGLLFSYGTDNLNLSFATILISSNPFYASFVGEIALTNLRDFYLKYSAAYWDIPITMSIDLKTFFTNQLLFGYNNTFWKPIHCYAAILDNFLQKGSLSGYLGITVGTLLERDDWAVDTNLQFVGTNAIPDFDFSGTKAIGDRSIGFELKAFYLVTDECTLLGYLKYAKANQEFLQVGLNCIYAW